MKCKHETLTILPANKCNEATCNECGIVIVKKLKPLTNPGMGGEGWFNVYEERLEYEREVMPCKKGKGKGKGKRKRGKKR